MIVPILGKAMRDMCNMMRVVLTKLDELAMSYKVAPSGKKAWVRKVDTIHPLRGSGSGLT
jgi:hypothetical protein